MGCTVAAEATGKKQHPVCGACGVLYIPCVASIYMCEWGMLCFGSMHSREAPMYPKSPSRRMKPACLLHTKTNNQTTSTALQLAMSILQSATSLLSHGASATHIPLLALKAAAAVAAAARIHQDDFQQSDMSKIQSYKMRIRLVSVSGM
eukprot:365778-Chlamydomonas_euryale.AAC.12